MNSSSLQSSVHWPEPSTDPGSPGAHYHRTCPSAPGSHQGLEAFAEETCEGSNEQTSVLDDAPREERSNGRGEGGRKDDVCVYKRKGHLITT